MSEINQDLPKYYPDVSRSLNSYRKSPFQGIHITSIANPTVRKVAEDFADRNGCFGMKSEVAYKRTLTAQRIADANGDKQISSNELEVYNAFNDVYSKPVVGGVEFNPDELYKIDSISKNNNGTYTVKYYENNKLISGTYYAQNSDSPVKFSPSIFTPQPEDYQNTIAKN